MNPATISDASVCPLCGQPNDCQLCTMDAYKGPCWCAKMTIPSELIEQVPVELKNKACICRECVMGFHRAKSGKAESKILPVDFYFENGLMVLTETYLLRRGYCCGNGCRHCPYAKASSITCA
jgi:hypothetical protein